MHATHANLRSPGNNYYKNDLTGANSTMSHFASPIRERNNLASNTTSGPFKDLV